MRSAPPGAAAETVRTRVGRKDGRKTKTSEHEVRGYEEPLLAIALSVLVMAAWQYFYAGPLYQREHQA